MSQVSMGVYDTSTRLDLAERRIPISQDPPPPQLLLSISPLSCFLTSMMNSNRCSEQCSELTRNFPLPSNIEYNMMVLQGPLAAIAGFYLLYQTQVQRIDSSALQSGVARDVLDSVCNPIIVAGVVMRCT